MKIIYELYLRKCMSLTFNYYCYDNSLKEQLMKTSVVIQVAIVHAKQGELVAFKTTVGATTTKGNPDNPNRIAFTN